MAGMTTSPATPDPAAATLDPTAATPRQDTPSPTPGPATPPPASSPASPATLTLADAAALWQVRPGFLDSCSYGPPPTPAWDAMQQSLREWREGAESWRGWADSVDASRESFAAMVGIAADRVATGASVSQLLAPIAAAVPDGATVLVPDIEFTSGVFPFAVHADRGVTVRTTPLDQLAGAIDESVYLVSLSAVQSSTGEVADLATIIEAADAANVVIHVDGTQAAGWLPLDAMQVDFLSVHAYKWLCAPRGSAFLTMHPRLAECHPKFAERLKPLAANWYSAEPGAYYGMPLRMRGDARAYDISPAWHSWVGTAPALDVLRALGVDRIYEHNVALANRFRAGVGLRPSNSAIVSAALHDGAVERLRAAGIRFTVMGGRARLAFHLYTTESDVDAALEAVG